MDRPRTRPISLIPEREARQRYGVSRSTFCEHRRPDSKYYKPEMPPVVRVGGRNFYDEERWDFFMSFLVEGGEDGRC